MRNSHKHEIPKTVKQHWVYKTFLDKREWDEWDIRFQK